MSVIEKKILGAPPSPLLRARVGVLAVFLFVAITIPLHAQARGKRLVLKDGSYQIATKWEVNGDRVRYYSAERYDWEEIPGSLVDWPATNKYEKDREAGNLAEQQAAAAQDAADRQAEEERSPTVAPALRLPEQGGIFLFEQVTGSKPQLVELVQNGTDINKHTGKNILRSVINPLPTGPRQTVELKGTRARVQSHTGVPAIYVDINFDSDNDSDATNAQAAPQEKNALPLNERFKIVRVQKKGDARVVSNLKIALTGHMKEQRDVVDTRSTAISKDWLKLVPAQPLEPGEYALIEMLNQKQMNLYVWDFGVDPNAPANPTAWKPAPVKQMPTGTEDSPILHPPPKK